MRRGGGGRGFRRLLLWTGATLVAVLALAQLLLPRIAASTISSRVGRYGDVRSVSVSAWPAIELLWGHADSVRLSAASLALDPAQAARLVWEARGLRRIDARVEHLRLGSLALTQATFAKRGSSLSAAAQADQAAVRAALPAGVRVALLDSAGGRVQVRASGLFGRGAAVDAVAMARAGGLVVHPLASALSRLQLTLFSDPHIHVEGVGASRRAARPPSYRLTVSARLR